KVEDSGTTTALVRVVATPDSPLRTRFKVSANVDVTQAPARIATGANASNFMRMSEIPLVSPAHELAGLSQVHMVNNCRKRESTGGLIHIEEGERCGAITTPERGPQRGVLGYKAASAPKCSSPPSPRWQLRNPDQLRRTRKRCGQP